MEMEMETSNLPKELFIEILSWVPAKSLYGLRRVCKSWFDLINDSRFIKLHLDRTTQLVLNKPSLLICASYVNETSLVLKSLNFSANNGSPPTTERLPPPFKTSYFHQILGSCNGLVCMKSIYPFQRISLWNPCTNEYKELIDMSNGHSNCVNIGGFGYDRTIDDYKVICNTCYYDRSGYLETEVKVYTLGTNSWKLAESCKYHFVYDNPGLLVDGALYFMVKKPESSDTVIISFDIANERYNKEIALPQEIQDKMKRSTPPPNDAVINDEYPGVELQEIKGCLCISNINAEKFVDVWVMKEKDDYGVTNESWAKSFTIKPPINASSLVHLLGFCRNIEIVMLKDHKDLVWYNPNNDETRDLVTLRDEEATISFESFIESLVSPNQVTCSRQKRRKLTIRT